MEAEQAARLGDVLERETALGVAAVVAQQRVGMAAGVAPPGAAQNQHVGIAVVVVVGLDEIEPTVEPAQEGFGGALAEAAVARVLEVAQGVVEIPRRDHQVQIAVEIEIVDHHAA